MKKWLIGAGIMLLLLFVAGTYYFIPKKIVISKKITTGSSQQGLSRFLSNYANWKHWWPDSGQEINSDSILKFNGYKFSLDGLRYNGFQMMIQRDSHFDTSVIHLIPVGTDSTQLIWDAVVNTGNNPFTKISEYRKAKKIGNSLSMILDTLQSFTVTSKGVYGVDIRKEKVKIEYVVSAKQIFPQYPVTEQIYGIINNLREYAGQMGAKEEAFPMVNITAVDKGYLTQAGLPIDRQIPQKGNFSLKQLLKNGNILAAETKGGRNICDSAMKAVELYATDHNHFSIALPFFSLVTDRTKEKDSSKWVTKVYYPVN